MSESFLSGLTLRLIAMHRAWEGKPGARTKLSGTQFTNSQAA